jgi:hypothetical protein
MIKSITRKEFARHERMIRDALRLASTHDPDIVKWLQTAYDQIAILERQVELLGAVPYRVVRSSKIGHQAGIYAQRVRKKK